MRRLVARPAGLSRTARQALGYAELLDHVERGTSLDEALATAVRRTRRFARRQQRWFGRDPRVGWVPVGDGGEGGPATGSEHPVPAALGKAFGRLDGILGD